ncbi:MAG: carbonic anhydrase [Bacteroidota bacterium]
MTQAKEGLARLKAGNAKYVGGQSRIDRSKLAERRGELVGGQAPYAIVLGCADSRVPVEMVFDEGPGDLFVIRVAGNIAGPQQIGSIEYAVGILGTPLLVVLGHQGCGAVAATLAEVREPSGSLTAGLVSIVDAIKPSIAGIDELEAAVVANVKHTIAELVVQSPLLEAAVAEERLQICGAVYALDTGRVAFLDD